MIKQFFQNVNYIKQHPFIVYRGNGTFEELEVHENPGLTRDEISFLEKDQQLSLPQDYIELIAEYNGISFFHYSDCRIFDLASALSNTQGRASFEPGMLVIGIFYDDYVLIDCTGTTDSVFVSAEGIEKASCLNMSVGEFLDTCFLHNFLPFW